MSPAALSSLPSITAARRAFDQTELRARVGETVALRLDNGDNQAHSFDIDEFDVHIAMLPGKRSLALFTPSQPGTYTFYCKVPGHREAARRACSAPSSLHRSAGCGAVVGYSITGAHAACASNSEQTHDTHPSTIGGEPPTRIAACAGFALGGVWAADRPYMLRLTPPARIGEFYGLYGMVGRFSNVTGPAIWALVTSLTIQVFGLALQRWSGHRRAGAAAAGHHQLPDPPAGRRPAARLAGRRSHGYRRCMNGSHNWRASCHTLQDKAR